MADGYSINEMERIVKGMKKKETSTENNKNNGEKGTRQKKEKQIINVEIWTPYLLENIGERYDEEYVKKQIEMFGYNPDKLINDKKIITGRNIVAIYEQNKSEERPHLAIAGCTQLSEGEVKEKKGTGLLAARYSIFYSEPSDYSGNYPDASGYSLDIPKNPDVVKALLKDDRLLEAIVSRSEARIRKALGRFNSGIEKPVLATEYLSEALKCR